MNNNNRVIVRKEILDELMIGACLMSNPAKPVILMPWMVRNIPQSPHSSPRDDDIDLMSPRIQSPSLITPSSRLPWNNLENKTYDSFRTVTSHTAPAAKCASVDSVPAASDRRLSKGMRVVADPEHVKQRLRKAAKAEAQRKSNAETNVSCERFVNIGGQSYRHGYDELDTSLYDWFSDLSSQIPGTRQVKKGKEANGKKSLNNSAATDKVRNAPRKLRAAKVVPIWSGEKSRVLGKDALKIIADMFCVEKKRSVCTTAIPQPAKVAPLWCGDAPRKRSKEELAVIAALFCVEAEEDALLRRLRKHVVDFEGHQEAWSEASADNYRKHKYESTLVPIVEEDIGEIESEEECPRLKKQKKKKTNPFIRIYRYIRRKLFNK